MEDCGASGVEMISLGIGWFLSGTVVLQPARGCAPGASVAATETGRSVAGTDRRGTGGGPWRVRRPVRAPCERLKSQGRPERAVVAASASADLLVLARDGDQARLGPKSLGKAPVLSSTMRPAR